VTLQQFLLYMYKNRAPEISRLLILLILYILMSKSVYSFNFQILNHLILRDPDAFCTDILTHLFFISQRSHVILVHLAPSFTQNQETPW
jgi:predicted Na+-dependent transporter